MTSEQKKAYTAVLRGAEAARAREDLSGENKKVNYANILALLTKPYFIFGLIIVIGYVVLCRSKSLGLATACSAPLPCW